MFLSLLVFDAHCKLSHYRRALSSSSIDGVCAVINHACSVLDEKFIDLLRGRLKLGYPSGALSQAYNIVSSSIQQGKLQSQDVDKSRQQFLVSITIFYVKITEQHKFSPFSLLEVAILKVANFYQFLYTLQWRETKVSEIKTANSPENRKNLKPLAGQINVFRVSIYHSGALRILSNP